MPNDVINTITIGNTTYDIGGSGSGHTIEKSDGTDMTQRANLQFVDATVTDDSTNDRTKIENVKTITNESELDDLPDGIYIGPTDEGLPFDAGDIPYDNTESGLLADRVQGAIDELDDVITTDESTIEGNPINFSTLSAQNAESTIIDLEPIQDLHGYDKPWVGGAGKNKLPPIEPTSGGYASSGTFQLKAGSYILSFTNSSSVQLQYWLNGTYVSDTTDHFVNSGASPSLAFTVTADDTISLGMRHNPQDGTFSADDVSYEMIRLSTESSDYEPYTNICPISGRSEIGILGCGKNLIPDGINYIDGNTHKYFGTEHITLGAGTYTASYYNESSKASKLLVTKFVSGTGVTVRNVTVSANSRGFSIFTLTESSEIAIEGRFDPTETITSLSVFTRFQMEIGSTMTTYEPYTKSTDLTISFGETVYGGRLDVEKGELVVGWKNVVLNGTENWVDATSTTDYAYYIDSITDYKKTAAVNNIQYATKFILDKFNAVINTYDRNSIKFGEAIMYYDTSTSYNRLFLKSNISTTNTFKTWLQSNNVAICYELATPTVINLTPNEISLLEGINNISTTGDKITLTYRDGKMATLKDIKDSLESSKPVYSTVETVVGTYLNKPLYSKTYQIQFSSSNSYYFDVPSTMDIKFVLGGVYSTRFDFIPFGYGGSGGDMVQCYRFSDTQFRIQNAYYASRMYCDVTLQYTKSTD